MKPRSFGTQKPSLRELQAMMDYGRPAGEWNKPAFMSQTPRAVSTEPRQHTEHDSQAEIVKHLKLVCPTVVVNAGLTGELWGMARHVPKGIFYGWIQKLKNRGMLPGYADLVLHWGPAKTCFIEMKTKTGKEKDSQKDVREKLSHLGFATYIVRNLDDLRNVIKLEQIPCREHLP